MQCVREVLQHITVTVLCNGTDTYSSITYLIQNINDITGLLSVPQYQQCNINIVFSNNAGRSEPLVLLLGKLITTCKVKLVPTLIIDNTPPSLVTTIVIPSDTTNIIPTTTVFTITPVSAAG